MGKVLHEQETLSQDLQYQLDKMDTAMHTWSPSNGWGMEWRKRQTEPRSFPASQPGSVRDLISENKVGSIWKRHPDINL